MTFSYHTRAQDDIKCYLLWNGQNHRFYPQDVVGVLPQIFNMEEKAREEFIKSEETKKQISEMYDFTDKKFQTFYCSLRGKSDFPIKYDLNNDEESPQGQLPISNADNSAQNDAVQ